MTRRDNTALTHARPNPRTTDPFAELNATLDKTCCWVLAGAEESKVRTLTVFIDGTHEKTAANFGKIALFPLQRIIFVTKIVSESDYIQEIYSSGH